MASSSSQASESGSRKGEAIDDLLNRLGIDEDEIEDLVFEEEESAPKVGLKWMALVRVHTTNNFSPQDFEQNMRVAWSPAKEIEFHHLEGNTFTVQCFCLGDWLKVEQEGPWLFRQNAVCIEPYDVLDPVEKIDLNYIKVWIQIHKLPIGYRNETLIKNLVEKKVGKVIKVVTDVRGAGNFVRVRVCIDVGNSLARFVSISRAGQREIYGIKYEKFPKFCGACGFLGHTHLECGSGEHAEENLKWGEFLKAEWGTWHTRGYNGNRNNLRGAFGGRGEGYEEQFGGRGRGRNFQGRIANTTSWRHNMIPQLKEGEFSEGPTDDTASSPVKPTDLEMVDRETSDSSVKRRIDMGNSNSDLIYDKEGNVMDKETPMEISEQGGTKTAGIVQTEPTKRSKKAGANSPSLGSAGSHEESVRTQ